VETWDVIRTRRNVRAYDDRLIPPEHLERMLEAARRAWAALNRA
jgi:nitroreductase